MSADDKGFLICWRKSGSQAGMPCTIILIVTNVNDIYCDSGDPAAKYRATQALFPAYACIITILLLADPTPL